MCLQDPMWALVSGAYPNHRGHTSEPESGRVGMDMSMFGPPIRSGCDGTVLSIEVVGSINQNGYRYALGLEDWAWRYQGGRYGI